MKKSIEQREAQIYALFDNLIKWALQQ
jgi:hypothetical protein